MLVAHKRIVNDNFQMLLKNTGCTLNTKVKQVLEQLIPFIILGIAIALFIGLFIMLSYVLIYGIVLGAIIWLGFYIKNLLFPAAANENKGRIIDHKDKDES